MDDQRSGAAADLIWADWREGAVRAGLPAEVTPATRREGYAIQAHVEARSAHPLFGWKIAATSRAGQEHIGVDGPLAGRILAERVIADGGEVPGGTNRMALAEPEFAFRMAKDLPPRATPYSMDEVLAAVGTLHPAIELPDSRFEDCAVMGAPALIADNACGHWFVLGPETDTDWRVLDLSTHRVTARVADRLERKGIGANVLGDPRIALTWLVNELSGLGITLKAGQVVTTGTCMPPMPFLRGDDIEAEFGILGRVSVRIGK